MRFWILVLLGFAAGKTVAQKKITDDIHKLITRNETEAHLTFLAADEMRGRDTGSPELDIAAGYIRSQFKQLQNGSIPSNLRAAPATNDFFQNVELIKFLPPSKANASVGSENFTLKSNLLVLSGESIQWEGDMIYVGYASQEELAKLNLNGKMILALAGSKGSDNINSVLSESRAKYEFIKNQGAAGLIEVLSVQSALWQLLFSNLHTEQWGITQRERNIPFVWLKPGNLKAMSLKEFENVPGHIFIESSPGRYVAGKNVAAIVEGTDGKLKDEYVVVTAHYDHIGVAKSKNNKDSIFNGARDNAIGTVALIQTAKFLSRYPPKRSVILLAVTGEEKGKLGSRWYTQNPLLPLHKHVLNINCDGVGYNDKTRVTSISLGRTNTDHLLQHAAKTFGFFVGGDPDASENFYERSDQVSFARKGIPAIKLQPGLAQMDEEIRKYYHQQQDEVASLDFDYLTSFYKTFVFAVYLLANDSQKPAWKPGDKFEAVSKKLRGE